MRALLLALCLLAAPAYATGATHAWNFRVLLDGTEIGRHTYRLSRSDDELELSSQARFDVRVLSVPVYRYRHEAIERWRGDCLQSLVSRTDANGDRTELTAEQRAGRLLVVREDRREEHPGCVMSFAYWNPSILKARRLLNSQTGEVLPVAISAIGEETLTVRGERRLSQRHRIVARDLTIDLWFVGRDWVALEAPASGGRRLRYELL